MDAQLLGGSRISADFCRSKRRVIGLAETGGRPQPGYFPGGSAEIMALKIADHSLTETAGFRAANVATG